MAVIGADAADIMSRVITLLTPNGGFFLEPITSSILEAHMFFRPTGRGKEALHGATANDFPVENIINDGTTSAASRMGSVADLDLVLRAKPSIAESDVMVVAGDMIFSNDFDISGVQRFFREKQGSPRKE